MEPCCEDVNNRSEPENLSDDLSFTRCNECKRRHFVLTVDPGELGLLGSSL